MNEHSIQTQILKAIGGRTDVRLFRQNVGNGFMGNAVHQSGGIVTLENPRRVQFGLCPGSPDLVGWRIVEITPDMVGKRLAVFTGIEVKAPGGRASEQQKNFLRVLAAHGGLCGIAHNAHEAAKIVDGELAWLA